MLSKHHRQLTQTCFTRIVRTHKKMKFKPVILLWILFAHMNLSAQKDSLEIKYYSSGEDWELIKGDYDSPILEKEYWDNGKIKTLISKINDSLALQINFYKSGDIFEKGEIKYYWGSYDSILYDGGESGDSLIFFSEDLCNKNWGPPAAPCQCRIGEWREYHENGRIKGRGYYIEKAFSKEVEFYDTIVVDIKQMELPAILVSSIFLKTGTWKYWDDKGVPIESVSYQYEIKKTCPNTSVKQIWGRCNKKQ